MSHDCLHPTGLVFIFIKHFSKNLKICRNDSKNIWYKIIRTEKLSFILMYELVIESLGESIVLMMTSDIHQLWYCSKAITLLKHHFSKPQGGALSTYRNGTVQKIFRQCKKIKILAQFIIGNLFTNMKFPETMQIECQFNNIWCKKYPNIISILFGPNNITFGNILTQKFRTCLPKCACAECPPPLALSTH